MTSENELDVVKVVDTTEEINNEEIPSETEVPPIIPAEELTTSKEEEQTNVEKPKRAGRKKRIPSSTSDMKTDDLLDTQPLFEQPIIVEGKRSRKPTARLELTDLATPKKELSIPQGNGKPLGEIEYIDYQITHASTDAISRLRNICFGRRSNKVDMRTTLREFKGFEFERDGDEYQRHLSSLIKLKKDQLGSLSDILGLPTTGRNDEHAERILNFLMEPIDEGKQIPERKLSMRTSQKSSTNSKESINTDEEEEEKTENGDDDDDDDFDDEDALESDDDYIGSDGESGLHTKDDPDDFVYKPGKKIPKKKSPVKRSRSATTQKRKRGASTKSKRGRKKSKIVVVKKKENEDTSVVTEPMETTNEEIEKSNEEIEKSNEDNSTAKSNDVEPTNDNLNHTDTKLAEQNDTTTNNTNTDIIPATS